MMAKAADHTAEVATAQPAAGFDRAAAFNSAGTPFHPMMANPAAAMVAATAIGIGFATQMAGAFFGAMQAAMDASQNFAKTGSAEASDVNLREPEAAAEVPAAVVKVKAVRPTTPKSAEGVAARETVAGAKAAAPAKAPVKRRAKADDLKRISGIGPKLVTVLNGMGVARYADIANWSESEMGRIDAELGLDGRIGRDDWIGQAKVLAKKTT